MTGNHWMILGAILGAIGVAIGAFGAHGLENPDVQIKYAITAKDLARFETGVRYHLYHAAAIVLAGLLVASSARPTFAPYAAIAFILGTILFSGMLYIYAVFHTGAVVMLIPIGGVCYMVGWVLLAVAGGQWTPK